jgi:hypothetical protein
VTFELVLSHLRKRDFAVLSTIGIDRRDGRARRRVETASTARSALISRRITL